MVLTEQEKAVFLELLWTAYAQNGRPNLPWRIATPDGTYDPYSIMVSELMLQQTQVTRVIPKYEAFLARFPDAPSLARAELGEVLRLWQGLGYNRRAKFLWQAAQLITERGTFPSSVEDLVKLPGIGKNTAGAILAYAYNQPVMFVETNVRTVYIHQFFAERQEVSDTAILDLLAQTVDTESPREFYWALMDYGTQLKATVGNMSRASRHFVKQSAFTGSRRQVRGAVLRQLSKSDQTMEQLSETIRDERLVSVLQDLVSEGLVREQAGRYGL